MAVLARPALSYPARTDRYTLWCYTFLSLLVLLDVAFISLSLIRETPSGASQYVSFLQDISWRLDTDRGFPELVQYLKAAFVVLLLALSFSMLRAKTYLLWSLAFLYLIFDDAYHVHESFGKLALETLPLPTILGVSGFVYAEMLVWAGLGLCLMVGFTYLYFREKSARRFTRRMVYLFVLLFLFAGVADGIHELTSASDLSRNVDTALVAVEDGGEMIVLSIIAAYVLSHYFRTKRRLSLNSARGTPIQRA